MPHYFADLEQTIASFSIRAVIVATIFLAIFIGIAALVKGKPAKRLKAPLFTMICFVVISTTLALFSSTVYLNTNSDSGGPVHWHTDFEVWACGNELEYRDPSGFLSNKVGTSTYHEHNDKRIHLEGVVVDSSVDASLKKFVEVSGGRIDTTEATIPLGDSVYEDDADGDDTNSALRSSVDALIETDLTGRKSARFLNGRLCGDQTSELQAYVYTFNKESKTYSQKKLADPSVYSMRDEATVPAGDCLIIEFGPVREQTDKLCQQYGVRDSERCTEFGAKENTAELCDIRDITVTSAGGTN